MIIGRAQGGPRSRELEQGIAQKPTLGWHYLSHATCLVRPHLFLFRASACLIIRLIEFAALFVTFEEDIVRQVAFDKWLPLKLQRRDPTPELVTRPGARVRSPAVVAGRAGAPPREFTKGALVKGGFSNHDIIITHKLLNPPLLNPPL